MTFPLCRIQRMPPRFAVLIAVSSLSLIVLGCGVTNEGGSTNDALTAELVVPPAEQEIAPAPTSTQSPPTATTIPATMTSQISKAGDPKPKPQASVPNRGYNAMGSEEAPITMFDFSDFL